MVLRYVSPSSSRILGWKPEEMTGKRPDDFILSAEASFLPDSLVSGLDRSPLTVRMRKKDGTIAWVEIKHRMICDPGTGEPTETVIVIRDTTESRMLQEQLSALELTDSITGLSTQRAFDDALQGEWNRTLREGSTSLLCCSTLTISGNSMTGVNTGKGIRCLAKAAAEVIRALRITDFAARYGTEDIAVILPSTGPDGATKVAAKGTVCRQHGPYPDSRARHQGGTAHRKYRHGDRIGPAGRNHPQLPELLRLAADNALQKAKQNRTATPYVFPDILPEA